MTKSRNDSLSSRGDHSALDEFDVPGPALPFTTGSSRRSGNRGGSTVTFADLFALLRRRVLVFVVAVLVSLLAALGALRLATKQYDAQSAVTVAPVIALGDTGSTKDISTITESRIVTSTAVAQIAARTLRYSGSLDSLLQHVAVNSPLSSQLIYISYTSESPRGAADGANAFANAYLTYRRSVGETILAQQARALKPQIQTLLKQLSTLSAKADAGQRTAVQSQISSLNDQLYTAQSTVVVPGQVISLAKAPSSPSSPKKVFYIAGGVLAGLVLGLIAAVVRDRRDDKLHGPADLERLIGAPVLATVGRSRKSSATPAILAAQPVGSGYDDQLDAYRLIATKLRAAATGKFARSLLVMRGGAVREEGAPINIATTLARQGVRTALVTTDRGVRQAAALLQGGKTAITRSDGLSPVPGVPNLWLLSFGNEDVLHGAEHDEQLLQNIDISLLDAVNLNLTSSALALGSMTDSALIVAVDGRTTHAEAAHAVRELAQVGVTPLGGVLFVRRARHSRRSRRRRDG